MVGNEWDITIFLPDNLESGAYGKTFEIDIVDYVSPVIFPIVERPCFIRIHGSLSGAGHYPVQRFQTRVLRENIEITCQYHGIVVRIHRRDILDHH